MKISRNQKVSFLIFILVAVAAIFTLYTKDKYSTIDEKSKDFAVKDTARITKIFLYNTVTEESILLEREDISNWRLNGEFKARPHSKDLLLETIYNLEAKRPASPSAQERLYRRMSGKHTKVEIYLDNNDIPEKTLYLGDPNAAHSGTYMMMESRKYGRFEQIYDVHKPGHRGFLNPIFFTYDEEWRYSGIYDYKQLEFNKIDVRFSQYPEDNYSIEFKGGNNIAMFDPKLDKYIERFDTLLVKDYLLFYKKIPWSKVAKIDGERRDSILNSTPFASISVTENSGEVKTVELFYIPEEETEVDESEKFGRTPFSRDNYYGWVNKGELFVVQTYSFDNLLLPKSFFTTGETRPEFWRLREQ
jgi:hypothetical protein